MVADAAARDRLRVYALMEGIQGHAHADAALQLAGLEDEALRSGRDETALLAAVGRAMYALLRAGDRDEAAATVEALVVRAEAAAAPAVLAMALALRALGASERHDSAALLSDAGRAVALVDDESLPAVERCTALVVCAAAYNTLSLWELTDELYDRATDLEPACEHPVQAAAVAMNRLVIRLEWAAALLEADAGADALEQLRRAGEAARQAAGRADLQPLWALEAEAAADVLTLAFRALSLPAEEAQPAVRRAADHRRALTAAGSVELLPLLAGLEALSLHRLGRDGEAQTVARAIPAASLSSGALSFPAWVQAQALGSGEESEAGEAHRRYGLLVTRARWAARRGVLAAARSRIEGERNSGEHARLARDVLLDPLTGLANRRRFEQWRAAVPGHDQRTALLLIDLDSFKEVNDRHGHAAGDEVLRRLGTLLSGTVRSGDLPLRLGGDEFAVVLQDEPTSGVLVLPNRLDAFRAAAVVRAEEIQLAVGATDWSDLAPGLRVSVSIGVAVAVLGPHHPDAADLLYRSADEELYASKPSSPQGANEAPTAARGDA